MLRFSESISEADLRQAILECGRICYERRLLTANDGNISVRLGTGLVLITPSGLCKGRMGTDDLLLVGLDGKVHSASEGRKTSSETPMHLEVYKQRADVRAVLHAHPVFATTLTVADSPFPADVLPEVLLTLGEVPTTRYATPSSHDDAEAIRELIKTHDALLLRQHGSLTVGKDLETALTFLERIEHVAEVYWRARLLGKVDRIPGRDVEKLLKIKQELRS
ncbi:MAG: class II aldolase/adducin family protein [Anaerolineales bacterium]